MPVIYMNEDQFPDYARGWYFEDETNCYNGNGPYPTKEGAAKALEEYIEILNYGEEKTKLRKKFEGLYWGLYDLSRYGGERTPYREYAWPVVDDLWVAFQAGAGGLKEIPVGE